MSLKRCLEGVIFQVQCAAITETKRISNSSTPWKLIPGRGGCFETKQAIFNCVLKCTFLAFAASMVLTPLMGVLKHTEALNAQDVLLKINCRRRYKV